MTRHRLVLAAACAALATAALAGCARAGNQTVASDNACQAPRPSGSTLTITDADSGQRYCVEPGTTIEVYLHGSPDALWSKPTADSAALRIAPSGRGTLALGVTGGFFKSSAPGTVHLTAFRAPCEAASPVPSACDAAHSFQVTITVS